MPRKAQLYIAGIVASGLIVLASSLFASGLKVDLYLAATLLLSALISAQKLKIPGINGTVSGGFAFILLSIGKLDAEETVLVALVAALVQSMWKCTRQPAWYQVAFNVSTLILCSWFAHHAVHAFVPGASPAGVVAQLAIAALLLLVLNTFAVAMVVSLIEGGGVAALWDRCRFWALPYYLAGAGIASAILVGTASGPAWTSLLLAPAISIVAGYYRHYLEHVNQQA